MSSSRQLLLALAAVALSASCGSASLTPPPPSATAPGGSLAVATLRLPSLRFAVIGDTRPPIPDDTFGYPVGIIDQIYQSLDALSPRPDFVVGTGDYISADAALPIPLNQAQPQSELYYQATQGYRGRVFPALGNHDCATDVSTNCCPGCANGTPPNYLAFLGLLGKLGLPGTTAYYEVDFISSDPTRPWTAKLLAVAANAWDDGQAAWLEAALEKPTTYTFVARHEPDYDNAQCLGCGASDALVKAHPYTLLLTGHDHTFTIIRESSELVVGLGGASLDHDYDHYGYVLCDQQTDDSMSCVQHDYDSGASSYADSQLVVSPDGAVIK